MTTRNSSNQIYTNNADGWDLSGGTTARKLTVSGADIGIVGSGTAVMTFPATSATIARTDAGQSFTGTQAFSTITTTTLNGNTFTTGTYTLTGAAGKTLTFNNTITLAGTDATTMTFPSTSATIARTDAANTFTGVQTMTSPAITTSITTASTSFTAFAGATTLLTIGGTGASASLFAPSTLDTTSSITGAIRTSGGISAAKAGWLGTSLNIGTAGTVTGELRLSGSTSGTVTIKTKNTAGTWAMTLPDSAGTSGYVLTTDGAGITSWASSGAGTVTATGGSLTANAVVLGAGTTDTKVVTGITTDGTSQLNLGVNATTLGKVKLFGSTSGDVTLQPNAVAGTGIVLTLPATTGTLVTGGGTASGTNTGDNATNSQYSGLAASKEDVSNKATSFGTVNDTLYPSVQAVKTYADALVVGLLDYRGGYDASGNVFPSTGGSGTAGAVLKGDMWVISVAGTLGGNAVQIGDSIIANIDTPGQTGANWNTLNSNISYVPEDSANKVTSISGASTDVQYPSAKLLYDQLALKGSGTVTSVGTGAGLTGGAITTTGTVALNSKLSPMDTLTGNSLKFLRVNAGETAVEYATVTSGSGTVTHTGGALTSNAVVLGAGADDTKVVAGITSDGTAQLVLGVNTTTLGTVKMFGSTSGDVTVQPTAVAGTATVQTLPATTGTLVNRVTTANGVSASNSDGALTISLGAITPTTVNGNTFTTGTYTLTGTAAKTLNFTNTLTLSGTDSTTMTFPSTSSTVMTLASTDTITGAKTFAKTVQTVTAMSAQALDGSLGNVFTRTLAASETFTQSNFTAGQCFMVEVKQGSGTTYTVTWFSGITWITSGATAPVQTTTTNGFTTYGFRCTGSNTFNGYLIATQ